METLVLKLGETIKGEVTLRGYEDQIQVLSFTHGISQSIVHGLIGRTGTVGPKHQDLGLSKYCDLASIGILSACDHGSVIADATLTVGHADADTLTPYLVISLRDVILTSVSMSGASGDRLTENVALNYTAIRWTYIANAGGANAVTTSTSWDLNTNSEIR